MRKTIVSFSFVMLMVISLVVPVFAETAHGTSINKEQKPKLTFNVLSDTHIRDSSFSTNKFLAALQDLHEIDPQADALVINGDMTNTGYPEEYAKLRGLLEQSPKPKHIYFSIGNHEFHNEEGNEINIERFKQFVDEDELYYEKKVKGYSFIFLGSESWGPVGTPTKDAAVLSEKQLNWLENTLEKRSKNEKPIFVYLHQPMPDTFGEGPMLIQHEELEEILSKYPQAILFSGHTHQDMRYPNTNMTAAKGFPIVNTASTYNTTFWPDTNWDESQGLYVQVYDDKVEIKGRDFHRKQWIPETHYTIDIPSATTFSFDGQYVFPGETNTVTSTFTNYGQKTMENLDFGLNAPDGWAVEATSDTHFDKLAPGNSIDIDWYVTPPEAAEPGFVTLNANAFFIYDGKKKQHELSTIPTIRVVPKPPMSNAYLSDMVWAEATNHWGPVERDQSVGGKEIDDGKTLTIGGVEYEKGLGAHAISEVSYYLGGNFSTFTADVGVDDEVGDKGSVVFQVWADGKKVYDSGVITGSDSAKKVQVDISGVNQLRLYITDANDGRQHDHADWANAYISVK